MLNNRFKFRIWDKPTNKMFYDVCIGFIKDGCPPPYDWICADTPDGQISYTGERLKDIEIMQCTGLKDKNGKLIYEGDILKVTGSRDTSGCGVVEYLQAGCQFFVNGYLDYLSPYHPRRKGEFYQQLQEWLCTEVIGNIYENTELLEEKCNSI